MSKNWKNVELQFARRFGVERNQDTHGPDFFTDRLSAEVKHRKSPAIQTVERWLKQSIDNAIDGLLPILIVHRKRDRFDDAIVSMKMSHFLKLVNGDEEFDTSKTQRYFDKVPMIAEE